MPKGIANNPEAEAERRNKISASRRSKIDRDGFLNSPETRAKISIAKKGGKLSLETRQKMSEAHKGKRPKNWASAIAKAHAAPFKVGEDHQFWKGDDVGYAALHAWVSRRLGTPSCCARCGTTTARRYEWANISREYRRDLTDWERLCVSCHRRDGVASGEYGAPWNKGLKVQSNTGRTHIKPGEHLSPQTEFKAKDRKT